MTQSLARESPVPVGAVSFRDFFGSLKRGCVICKIISANFFKQHDACGSSGSVGAVSLAGKFRLLFPDFLRCQSRFDITLILNFLMFETFVILWVIRFGESGFFGGKVNTPTSGFLLNYRKSPCRFG